MLYWLAEDLGLSPDTDREGITRSISMSNALVCDWTAISLCIRMYLCVRVAVKLCLYVCGIMPYDCKACSCAIKLPAQSSSPKAAS